MERRGIDVSTFQGNINWPRVANTDVKFAMIRSSYGSSGIDEQFANNMQNIQNTPLFRGAYHHTYANSVSAAQAEARHFLNVIKPYSFNYPLALDLEEPTLIPLGKEAISNIARAFCKVIEDAGYYILIYSSLNWLRNYLDDDLKNKIDIWLAQWNTVPSYDGNFGMWQYTDSGRVDGINGNVDMNVSYKDYPTIIKDNGYNDGSDNIPVIPTPTPNPNPGPSNIYTVKQGDTLWSIAQRFLGNGMLYTQIKSRNGLTSDTIYVGQKLVIPSNDSTDGGTNPPTPQLPNDNTTTIRYTVKTGDTLWSIAEKLLGNGSLYTIIKEANNLSNDKIYVGQSLVVPIPTDSASQITYSVKSGDTLWSIAERFLGNGNLFEEIKSANSLTNNTIYVGQKLIIPRAKP